MTMTQERFEALVARVEKQAAENPALYKAKLGVMAALGYLYIFGVLLLLLALTGGLVAALAFSKGLVLLAKKVVLPFVIFIGVVCKSLWVKIQPPAGRELRRGEFPELFAAIDEVRARTQAPPVHVVMLNGELNAAIMQIPRLGLFGWQKNYLILGLQLLQLLPVDEFKAVLAHEFGHLSGAHGRFGAWIYRIRAGWAQLNARLQEEKHRGSFMFVPFFNWFAPQFAAYSFVQARRQEYEADALAREIAGAAAMATALIRLDVKAEEMELDYWPGIYADVEKHPAPTAMPYVGLLNAEQRGFLPAAADKLQLALQRATTTSDTHPCLRDRLAALAHAPALPDCAEQPPAASLLGAKLHELVAQFDEEWRANVSGWWNSRHERMKDGRAKLAVFEERELSDLSDLELYDHALLVEEFGDLARAFGLFEALVRERGATKGAKFAYGRLLLWHKDDASGIQVLEDVMDEVPELILPGCETIVHYLRARGREMEAARYIDRHTRHCELLDAAHRERETLRPADKWLPPEMDRESLDRLKAELARHKVLKRARLVRKLGTEGLPAIHVLGFERRWARFEWTAAAGQQLAQKIADAVQIEELRVLCIDCEDRGFGKRFRKVAGSLIYGR